MLPYGRHEITDEDIKAVEAVLRSDQVTQGESVPLFEKTVAEYCNVSHSVAVNSATSALHIACVALGLGPGDFLWTSPNTFVASANCALYCNANLDFVDIDSHTYNMCVDALSKKLEKADKDGCLPKIVVPVHFAGQPCDMAAIKALSDRYGFKIIEDASHAIGASYADIKVGSCMHSDITVFSFHPVKIITTGEGGMALTKSERLASHMRRLRSHGITTDKDVMSWRPKDEIWNYQQIELGFNYRITDIQAALGISQMDRLNEYICCRREIAGRYNDQLRYLNITLPWQAEDTRSSFHLYPIRINDTGGRLNQRHVYNALRSAEIAANLHYIPVHRHPYYEGLGFRRGDYPEAEQFHREVISLPIFPSLKMSEQDKVSDALRMALG